MPIMAHGYGDTGHLIPHMEVWISHPISVISIRDMRLRISCISKGILDIPHHIYPYEDIGYPISSITIWDIACLISAISMGDRGYQFSYIPRSILDMGAMWYPTSHPNDYWVFNTCHIHSGILYIQYPHGDLGYPIFNIIHVHGVYWISKLPDIHMGY